MKQARVFTQNPGQQLNLLLERNRLEGMNDTEKRKALSALAQILVQAAPAILERGDVPN
ncbi:MAG: hypothetical protein FWD68_19525 [Alphaproteobacteria bacterium]|nr:hypothetical protein [Alphaproteobacteria bacterium]